MFKKRNTISNSGSAAVSNSPRESTMDENDYVHGNQHGKNWYVLLPFVSDHWQGILKALKTSDISDFHIA